MRKDTQWMWGDAQQKAFEASKELLTSAKVLVHFTACPPHAGWIRKTDSLRIAHFVRSGEKLLTPRQRSRHHIFGGL